jgi:hypothetical protein
LKLCVALLSDQPKEFNHGLLAGARTFLSAASHAVPTTSKSRPKSLSYTTADRNVRAPVLLRHCRAVFIRG